MLSPLDDLPIHQVAETMATVGTTDRNFYDRYYFNMHGGDGEFFLVAGLGQYPNLGVTDAFLAVAHGDTQSIVRASRPLGLDRLDTRVGPLRVEVLQGLQRLRLVCEPAEGFALDVTWQGAVPAFQEPRQVLQLPHGRSIMNTMRFLQTGSWSGSMTLDGREIAVTPDRFWGNRDRSWGVRPVGEAEPAGIGGMGVFYWNYFVARFAEFSLVYMVQENEHGRRAIEEALRLFPDGRVEHLGRPEHALRFAPGTRMVTGATVQFAAGRDTAPLTLQVETLRPVHIAVGTGYGFDADWRHGKYQGPELVVQRKDLDTTAPEIVPIPGAIVDHVARFTLDGEVGYGLCEVMTMGPHVQYFTGWDDTA